MKRIFHVNVLLILIHEKHFPENYVPITVWLWFYKSTENNCHLQLLTEFIQAKKRYPTSLDKISILTWRLLVISSQKFFLWTKLFENLLLAKYLISAAAALTSVMLVRQCIAIMTEIRFCKKVKKTWYFLPNIVKKPWTLAFIKLKTEHLEFSWLFLVFVEIFIPNLGSM